MDDNQPVELTEREKKELFYSNYQSLVDEIESITKNKKGFGYSYADLEAVYNEIRPKVKEKNFVIMQTVEKDSGEFKRSDSAVPVAKDKEGNITLSGRVEWSIPCYNLHTEVIHLPTYKTISCDLPLVMEDINPQSFGSALTYMRRYSLFVVLGIITEDDDGAQASQSRVQRAQQSTKKPLPEDFENAKKFLMETEKKTAYYGDVKNSDKFTQAEKQALFNVIYPK